jgi:hypothetical protein
MAHAVVLDRLVRGAAAGVAGTLALQVMRTASEKALPATMPPIRQDPGEFMLKRAEETLPASVTSRLTPAAEAAAAKGLAAGYGVTAGALYAFLRSDAGEVLTHGIVLGVGTWAAGYLGWLPALGLLPAVQEQDVPEAIGPLVRHALFGIAVVATYRALASSRASRSGGDLARGSSMLGELMLEVGTAQQRPRVPHTWQRPWLPKIGDDGWPGTVPGAAFGRFAR